MTEIEGRDRWRGWMEDDEGCGTLLSSVGGTLFSSMVDEGCTLFNGR